MRVLALIDSINVSGPGRQLVASARELAAFGVEITLGLFERRGEAPRPFQQFVCDSNIRSVVFKEKSAFDTSIVAAVRTYVKENDPDIIQSHGYKPSAVAWSLAKSGARRPWIAFFHGSTTENVKVRAYHALDQWLMRSATGVVLMSELHARRLGKRFPSARVIHNAVLFPPSKGFARPEPVRVPPRLLFVGRLSSEKGADTLLRACALLDAAGMPVELTIVGDGPDRGKLEHLASSLRLRSVRFTGHQTNPAHFYASADLLAIPSRSEGLPNVLLEALSHGLPVVATAVGAIPEVITNPRIGSLCNPDDPAEFANAITHCLSQDFRSQGVEARKEILETFSVRSRAKQLHALYESTLADFAKPARSTLAADNADS